MKKLLVLALLLLCPAIAPAQTPDAAIEGYTTEFFYDASGTKNVKWWLDVWLYDPVGYDVYQISVTITDSDGTSNTKYVGDPIAQPSCPGGQTSWYADDWWIDPNTRGGYLESNGTPMNFAVGFGWGKTQFVTDMTVRFGYYVWNDLYGTWDISWEYTAHPYYYNSAFDNVRYQLDSAA